MEVLLTIPAIVLMFSIVNIIVAYKLYSKTRSMSDEILENYKSKMQEWIELCGQEKETAETSLKIASDAIDLVQNITESYTTSYHELIEEANAHMKELNNKWASKITVAITELMNSLKGE